MRTRVGRSVVLATILFALPLATRAAEGRTPLFEPGPITTSGKYVLTRNITGTGGTPTISVQAPRVEIDLNGFTVSNSNGDSCIQVLSPSVRLTVRNGTLAECFSGLHGPAASQIVLEDVTVSETWGNGIHLIDVGSIVLQRVRVLGAGLDGVGIYSPFPHTAVIEDCTIRGTGANGIVFQTGSAEIRNNRVISAGYGGILLSGATGSEVSGNLVVGAANDVGITLSATQGSTIAGNVVRSSYFHGIWVQSDSANNVVRDNVSTGNGLPTPGHGLFVQGTANMIEGNTLNGNGGAGLFFNFTGCGNTFGRNMARGNVGSGVGGCGALFAPESCTQCGAGTANVSFGDNLIPGPPAF